MKIKIVLLSVSKSDHILFKILNEYRSKYQIFLEYYKEIDQDNKFSDYKLLNTIQNTFENTKHEADILIILNQDTIIYDVSKFMDYLEHLNFKHKIFAFRYLNIRGLSFKYGPRIPFIDDSIIVINIKNALEKNFFNRKLINSCHFYPYGTNHALLNSFIECSLSKNEFINIASENSILNQYGEISKHFFPFPYSICKNTSIINADFNFNGNFEKLIESIISSNRIIFLKKSFLLTKVKLFLEKLHRKIKKFENKEFVKTC